MPHIHLVDSDNTSLSITAALLERAHYHISSSSGGRDALRAVFGSMPDMVILEAELNDYDGFEVLRRIRRSLDTPVVFYSQRARAQDRIMGCASAPMITLPNTPLPLNSLRVSARCCAAASRRVARRSSG